MHHEPCGFFSRLDMEMCSPWSFYTPASLQYQKYFHNKQVGGNVNEMSDVIAAQASSGYAKPANIIFLTLLS